MPPVQIHEDAQPYLEQFIEDAEAYSVPLPYLDKLRTIQYQDFPGSLAGTCTQYYKEGNLVYTEIKLAKRFQYSTESLTFKALIYHELGHCVLFKDHRKGRYIMNESMLPEGVYRKYWDELLDDFFIN